MRRIAPALLFLVSACSVKLHPSITKAVGTTGGTVAIDQSSSIAIPTGALTSTTTISATATPDVTAPASTVQVGPVFTFGPEGTRFATPVTVTLPFDSSLLPAGATADDVQVLTAPAGSSDFQVLPTQVAADGKHIEAQTAHFSIFTVTVIVTEGQVVHFKATDPNGSAPPDGVVLDPQKMAPPSTGSVDAGMPDKMPPPSPTPVTCKLDFRPSASTSCSGTLVCNDLAANGFSCAGTICKCQNGLTFDAGSICVNGDVSVAAKVCGFGTFTTPPPSTMPPPAGDMGAPSCVNAFSFDPNGACSVRQHCNDGDHALVCDGKSCTCGDQTFAQDATCQGGDAMTKAAAACGFAPTGPAPTAPPPKLDASLPPPLDASLPPPPPPPADGGVKDACVNTYAVNTSGCSVVQQCPGGANNAIKCDGQSCTCANQTVMPQGEACAMGDALAAALAACGFAPANPPPSTTPPPPPPADAGVPVACSNSYDFGSTGGCSAIQRCPDATSNWMKCDGQSCTCANQTTTPQGNACDGADGMRAALASCGFEASGNPPLPPPLPPTSPTGPTGPTCDPPQLAKSDTGCREVQSCDGHVYAMLCDAKLCTCSVDDKSVASFPSGALSCDLADGTASDWSNGCKFK